MKIKFLLGVLAIGAVTALNSCKDDEVPVAGVNFEAEEQEVTESDGTPTSFHPDDPNSDEGVGRVIKAKLIFDIPLAGDAVLDFDVDGSARQTSNSTENNDFTIEAEGDNLTVDGSQVTILKGSSEASFNITIYEDSRLEFGEDEDDVTEDGVPFETIEITLESVVTGPIKLGEHALTHEVRILEDDTYVLLGWVKAGTEDDPADIDMDIWVYINENLAFKVADSDAEYKQEAFLIPAGVSNLKVGMRYVYIGGSHDVDFQSLVVNYGGTIAKVGGATDVAALSDGSYELDNKHADSDPKIISQSMSKSGFNYADLTEITIPSTGSRIRNSFNLDQRALLKKRPVKLMKVLK
jgi:hypothetical protein